MQRFDYKKALHEMLILEERYAYVPTFRIILLTIYSKHSSICTNIYVGAKNNTNKVKCILQH